MLSAVTPCSAVTPHRKDVGYRGNVTEIARWQAKSISNGVAESLRLIQHQVALDGQEIGLLAGKPWRWLVTPTQSS